MLFSARSENFVVPLNSIANESKGVVRSIGRSLHRPWFVATFMHVNGQANWWETVCTAREEDLVHHLKQCRNVRFATVNYMAPPHPARSEHWSSHRLHIVEKGVYQGSEVTIYTIDGMERHCVEFPHASLDQVTAQRIILDVRLGRIN